MESCEPSRVFFVTTDRLDQVADGIGTQVGRTRLWRLTFDDIQFPELGDRSTCFSRGVSAMTRTCGITLR